LNEWARAHPEVGVVWLNAASPEESLKFVSDTGAEIPIAPYSPEDNLMDKYRVRVTPFMFFLDENGVIRAKGLVNTKAGVDLYYKEYKDFKAGKKPVQPTMEPGEQDQEQPVVPRAS
jgi:hypothetical protein